CRAMISASIVKVSRPEGRGVTTHPLDYITDADHGFQLADPRSQLKRKERVSSPIHFVRGPRRPRGIRVFISVGPAERWLELDREARGHLLSKYRAHPPCCAPQRFWRIPLLIRCRVRLRVQDERSTHVDPSLLRCRERGRGHNQSTSKESDT